MSHPFTLEYMQEGETSSNQISGDINKRKGNQEGSAAHIRQMESRQSTRIVVSDSVTDGCQPDQVDENPDGDMEMIKDELNITITDKERVSFFKILRMAMKRRMEIFAEEVSIIGLTYFFKPSNHKIGSIIRKVVWAMLLLFGTGFMVFQMYDRISYYLTYPTIVDYRVAYNRSLRFPTVTICSDALISKKALLSIVRDGSAYRAKRQDDPSDTVDLVYECTKYGTLPPCMDECMKFENRVHWSPECFYQCLRKRCNFHSDIWI